MELACISCGSCKNCKYYVEHYVIVSTQLMPIGGHCINDALFNPNKKIPYVQRENCTYWESDKELKEKREQTVNKVFDNIEKHLLEIKMILEADRN